MKHSHQNCIRICGFCKQMRAFYDRYRLNRLPPKKKRKSTHVCGLQHFERGTYYSFPTLCVLFVSSLSTGSAECASGVHNCQVHVPTLQDRSSARVTSRTQGMEDLAFLSQQVQSRVRYSKVAVPVTMLLRKHLT